MSTLEMGEFLSMVTKNIYNSDYQERLLKNSLEIMEIRDGFETFSLQEMFRLRLDLEK